MSTIRRTLATTVKVLNAEKGLIEYTASDETIDSSREICCADGWNFDKFTKNAPFVNSHDYSTIENLLGQIIGWRVEDKQLILTAQWAKDIPGTLAEIGWKLTMGGFLKAVSVGFWPMKLASKWDSDPAAYKAALKKVGRTETDNVATIYLQQDLVELSACILGANPNAVARAYKAGALTDADLETLSVKTRQSEIKAMEAMHAAASRAPSPHIHKNLALAAKAAAASIAVQ